MTDNMKQRLLVMNGQKLAQNEMEDGTWKTEKISKAQGIKAGIYHISNAVNADLVGDNIGEVIHHDKKRGLLYQKNDSQFIKHETSNLDKIPEIGIFINITYS